MTVGVAKARVAPDPRRWADLTGSPLSGRCDG